MESIVLLVIFLVFRTVFSHLLETQKTQKHPFPKTPVRPRGYQLPPKQDIKPKTIEIAEPKKQKQKLTFWKSPSKMWMCKT